MAHIKATFNNTIVSITDLSGNVLAWASAGSQGFKGSRKGTPFAAQIAASTAVKKAMEYGLKNVEVFIKRPRRGQGSGAPVFTDGRVQHNDDKGRDAHPS